MKGIFASDILEKNPPLSSVSNVVWEVDLAENGFLTFQKYTLALVQNWSVRWTHIPTFDRTNSYRLFLQKYPLSCEIAGLRMLLESARGIIKTEEEIIIALPKYPVPLTASGIWGDPDREFVWDILGSQYAKTGYGIYERPLVDYLSSIGVSATFSNRLDGRSIPSKDRLRELLAGMANGSRVMLWGDWCTSEISEDGILPMHQTDFLVRFLHIPAMNPCARSERSRIFSWYTNDGKEVRWISGEHVFLLLGYYGTIGAPTHVIVWDTSTGRHIFPIDEWMRKWNALDDRSLTIFGVR